MTMPDCGRTSVSRRVVRGDALPAPDELGGRKEIETMTAYTIFAVNEHLEFLLEEAARNHATKAAKPSLRQRIAGGAAKFRLSVATATYETSSIFPKLEDYPYRG
jgi:hypothetical protein